MSYDVREGVIAVSGNVGIGGQECPSMEVHIGCGAASLAAGDTVGIGNNTPVCRFEVREDGAVGIENQV